MNLFSCNSQFGTLKFWDTCKSKKKYNPEVISSNESEEFSGSPYDFRPLSLGKGDFIVDIGAHVGTVSIYLAKMFPDATIYAMEPMPINHECLKRNIEMNEVTNVHPVRSAVTSDGRTLPFTYRKGLGNSQSAHMSSSEAHKKNDKKHDLINIDVPSVNIDSFLSEIGAQKLALLKIDCEGAEYEVLYNLKSIHNIANIRGELHSSIEENDALVKHIESFPNFKSIRFVRNKSGEQTLSGYQYYPLESEPNNSKNPM